MRYVIHRAHLEDGRTGTLCVRTEHVLRLRNRITRTGRTWQSRESGSRGAIDLACHFTELGGASSSSLARVALPPS